MLQTFATWNNRIQPLSNSDTRMMDVVCGCFVGVTNSSIFKALQIVYVDWIMYGNLNQNSKKIREQRRGAPGLFV